MTLTRSTRATFSFEVCITRSDIMVYLHVQCFCWLGHHLGIARTVTRHSLVPMICILLSVKNDTDISTFFIWYTMRKKLPKTLDQLIFCKCTLNALKFTKYLVNVHKFTKYLVNSYHQKGVKHYVLTNWYQMTKI